jgi:excisionase family DNA binding protein
MEAELTALTDEQLLCLLKARGLVRSPSPWMGPQETAAYLGIALGTLRNWTSARFIPFSRKGRVVRYHRHVIDKWLAKGSCSGRATLANF